MQGVNPAEINPKTAMSKSNGNGAPIKGIVRKTAADPAILIIMNGFLFPIISDNAPIITEVTDVTPNSVPIIILA